DRVALAGQRLQPRDVPVQPGAELVVEAAPGQHLHGHRPVVAQPVLAAELRAPVMQPDVGLVENFTGHGILLVRGGTGVLLTLRGYTARWPAPAGAAVKRGASGGPAGRRAGTTTMSHRCCPDHDDVTSSWLAGGAAVTGVAAGRGAATGKRSGLVGWVGADGGAGLPLLLDPAEVPDAQGNDPG